MFITRFSVFLFFLFFPYLAILGQNKPHIPIFFDTKNEVQMIGKQVYFLEDENGKLQIEDLKKTNYQAQFKKHDKDVFARPASKTVVWFKISVQNRSQEDLWLELGGSLACWYVDFYEQDSTGNLKKVIETGTFRPEKNKAYPVNFFWLPLAKKDEQKTKTYYISIRGGMPHEYPLYIGSLASLHKKKQGYDFLTAGVLGIMLIMFFYNLFLAISTKDKIYFIYVFYLLTLPFSLLFNHNYPFLQKWLYDSTWWWDYYMVWININIFIIAYFAIVYLRLKYYSPRMWVVMWFFVFIMFPVFPLLNLAGFKTVDLTVPFQINLLFLYITMFYVGIRVYWKGYKNARFYVFGWFFAILSTICIVLVINGVFPYNIISRNSMYFGYSLEVLLFSLALADSFNIIRKEKEQAQTQNIQLIKEQKENLEHKIDEKTHHLQLANQELQLSNQELYKIQERMIGQKEVLEQKNEELEVYRFRIGKSIDSAKLIQDAILPTEQKIRACFKDNFILFIPKDIVSGDFYWCNQVENKKIMVVGDCTGHGISGAFMTMIGTSLLDKIININKTYDPAQILETLHRDISLMLQQEQTGNTDGMDVVIVCFEQIDDKNQVVFSGAKRPLYYVDAITEKLQKIAGTRKNIGGLTNHKKAFVNELFFAEKDSMFYLTTDGFADQNDPSYRKYGERHLIDLLEEIYMLSPIEQHLILEKAFTLHSKDSEQRDDVTILGIRI